MVATAALPAAELARALAAAQRATWQYADRPDWNAVRLAVGNDQVDLYGRDYHRSHLVTLDAETTGETVVVAVRRDDVKPLLGGARRGSVLLEVTPEEVRITNPVGVYSPPDSSCVSVPATPAALPPTDDRQGAAGVVVPTRELLLALRAHLPVVELHAEPGRLVVSEVEIPASYATGRLFSVLLDRTLLLDAVRAAGLEPDLTLEFFGPFDPLRIASDTLVAWIAQRSAAPLC
jgi:hypothetical protein